MTLEPSVWEIVLGLLLLAGVFGLAIFIFWLVNKI